MREYMKCLEVVREMRAVADGDEISPHVVSYRLACDRIEDGIKQLMADEDAEYDAHYQAQRDSQLETNLGEMG